MAPQRSSAVGQTSRPKAAGEIARLYHRLTSYAPEREWDVPVDDPRVLKDFEPNLREAFRAP